MEHSMDPRLEALVKHFLLESSTCWIPQPVGAFDTDKANRVATDFMLALEDYIALRLAGYEPLPTQMVVRDALGQELSRTDTFIGRGQDERIDDLKREKA